ncbi:MAG: response regulator [Methylococcaceae bacterium]|nr:response regulator [Methylococcaceae bacterium]MDZ4155149.1 response regulator [Methylococcales bacterium]MDP2394407.1 response regulator [Methylococcaceae bacterium]MDP3021450.1 response regulator [Methylococcaceae bacterium]MDP3388576.1 response regulator [Methylococcaceae bacterium]
MTKILVVDDELLVMATIAMGLQQRGYKVMQADNGADAMLVCKQLRPDLVLVDFRMPTMNGFELAKLYQSQLVHILFLLQREKVRMRVLNINLLGLVLLNEQLIPFVYISAYCDEEMVKTATEAGALGYLVKPLEISRIVLAIEAALLRADQQIKAEQTIEYLNSSLKTHRHQHKHKHV